MRCAALAIGPQGAGKSTFCKKMVEAEPGIVLVSRDAILLELFGSVYQEEENPGAYEAAWKEMWRIVARHLGRSDDVRLILDFWTQSARQRHAVVGTLQNFDFDRIEAWQFVTPAAVAMRWYFRREWQNIQAREQELRRRQRPEKGEEYYFKLRRAALHDRCQEYRKHWNYFISDEPLPEEGFDQVRQIDAQSPAFSWPLPSTTNA